MPGLPREGVFALTRLWPWRGVLGRPFPDSRTRRCNPESDARPAALCPECMAKVCWATGTDPLKRFSGLYRFCRAQGLGPQADFYARSIRALGGTVPAGRPPLRTRTTNGQ